jgi:hypothetical protein
MRGMRRRLFIFASTVSLLLCVATVVLWVRSYWVNDYVTWGTLRQSPQNCEIWGLVSNRGLCRVGWQDGNYVITKGFHYERMPIFTWGDRTTLLHRIGFSYVAIDNMQLSGGFHCDYRALLFPYWALAILAAICPTARFFGAFGPTLAKSGCPACGYDLRATPDRCPECGTAVTRNASTSV